MHYHIYFVLQLNILGPIIIVILQTRKVRLRDAKSLSQGHSGSKR